MGNAGFISSARILEVVKFLAELEQTPCLKQFRNEGLGFRGLGFRVRGLGFRVPLNVCPLSVLAGAWDALN